MTNFHIIDPRDNFPHDFDFSTVHYFMNPSWTAKKGEYCWLIWTGDMVAKTRTGLFYDEKTDSEYEAPYVEEKIEVKGMIELQQSPYHEDQIWLKFFEVTPKFKGAGFSKEMMCALTAVFKERYPGKILSRSRASDEGELKLKQKLSNALEDACVAYRYSSGC